MTLNEYAVNAGTAAGDASCAAAGRLEWTQDDARIARDAFNKYLADAEAIRSVATRLGGDLKPHVMKLEQEGKWL